MSRRNHEADRGIDSWARKFRRIAFGLSGEAAMSKIVALISALRIRGHWRATGRVMAVAGLALALSACGPMLKKGTPISEVQKDDQLRAQGLYVIAPGDQIEVVHLVDTDYNAVVLVKPDGKVSLPGLPMDVQASGRSTADLGREMGALYTKFAYIKRPNFSLIVRSYGSQQVFIGGEVQHPGYLEFQGGERSLMQVIMAAGGMLPTARTDEIIVVRNNVQGKRIIFSLNTDKIVSGEDLTQDMAIHPLDTVYVPRSDIAQADIWVDQHIRQLLPVPGSVSGTYAFNGASAIVP
jgi:protein involved in polysaccharide export with SLBB domain